ERQIPNSTRPAVGVNVEGCSRHHATSTTIPAATARPSTTGPASTPTATVRARVASRAGRWISHHSTRAGRGQAWRATLPGAGAQPDPLIVVALLIAVSPVRTRSGTNPPARTAPG